MEQVIKIFENEEFGKVRTVVKDGEPWFVGKDVAECLGYSKPRNAINAHVDNEDKALAPIQVKTRTLLIDSKTNTNIGKSPLFPKYETFADFLSNTIIG